MNLWRFILPAWGSFSARPCFFFWPNVDFRQIALEDSMMSPHEVFEKNSQFSLLFILLSKSPRRKKVLYIKGHQQKTIFCQDWIQNGQNSIPVYSLSVRTNYLSSFFVKNGIWSITHNVNASNIVLDWKCKKCIFGTCLFFQFSLRPQKNMIFLKRQCLHFLFSFSINDISMWAWYIAFHSIIYVCFLGLYMVHCKKRRRNCFIHYITYNIWNIIKYYILPLSTFIFLTTW